MVNTEIHAESAPAAGNRRRYALPLALLLALVTLFVIEVVSRNSEWSGAGSIEAQADLAGSLNGGALFQAVVLAIAALSSLRLAVDGRRIPRRHGWSMLTVGFVLLGIESTLGRSWSGAWMYVLGLALAFPALYFLRLEVRGHRLGQGLIVLTALLVLSNTATELAKRSIVSNNANYTFRAESGLYEFTGAAWDRLWFASNVQEFTEVAAIICLIAVIGIAADIRNRQPSNEAIQQTGRQ